MSTVECTHPGVQEELATGMWRAGYLCPRCRQVVYPDPDWPAKKAAAQQAAAAAQQAVRARLAPATLRGKYLGGFSFDNFKQLENGRVKLIFSGDGLQIKTWYGERRLSRFISGVSIEGTESVRQKLATGAFLAVGALALLAPTKKVREQKAYILVSMENGEVGIFELDGQNPMKVQAALSPWNALLRAGVFRADRVAPPSPGNQQNLHRCRCPDCDTEQALPEGRGQTCRSCGAVFTVIVTTPENRNKLYSVQCPHCGTQHQLPPGGGNTCESCGGVFSVIPKA